MKVWALLLAVFFAALSLAASGSDSAAETHSEEAATLGPKPEIPKGPKSEKPIVKDLVEGDGVEADFWLKGWEEGMPGMRVGGRRVLIIPTTPEDAPPGSELGDTLVYVVDLVEAKKPKDDS